MTEFNPSGVSQVTATEWPLLDEINSARTELIEVTQSLVRIPSETPPSDTRKVARAVAEHITERDNVCVAFHPSDPPIENLVAVATSSRPGKRLVLSGHLDTYPAGDASAWSDAPFSGTERDGKIFGRGSVDMKGGIACLLAVFNLMARNPHLWSGELVLALAGDEESMGTLGSQFLLETVPEVRGDAVLCPDVGSPIVPRIGEKGMIWINVFATGKPAHGAHVHRGASAIDALRRAMDALADLAYYPVITPNEACRAISRAKAVSEPLGGEGEAEILKRITVNFGRIDGGRTANLVADKAEVNADIRLPLGVTVAQIETEIYGLLAPLKGISFEIIRRYEPSWTASDDPIVTSVAEACHDVLGREPAINMRVGASDARLFRAAGIPTVVCGLTPHNLGGPDEFVAIDELIDVAKIHALAALRFLATG